MTGSELVAFRAVVATARDVVTAYRQTSIVHQGKMALLRDSAQFALSKQHARGVAELARIHIAEIADTGRLIDSYTYSYTSAAQINAMMSQLDILSMALDRNLRNYSG